MTSTLQPTAAEPLLSHARPQTVVAATDAQLRPWLGPVWNAAALRRYRCAAGLLLALHWLRQQHVTAGLLDAGWLPSRAGNGLAAAVRAGISSSWAFGAGSLLSLALACGVQPRLCAASVLVLAVSTQHALAPVAHLDDWASVAVAWWLLLWPTTPARDARRPTAVISWSLSVFLVQVLVSYVWLDGWRAMSPRWPQAPWLISAMCLLPGLYLLPLAGLRWLGPPAQLALHGYLAAVSGAWLAHALIAATALLLVGDRAAVVGTDHVVSTKRRAFDAPAALALGGSLLCVITALARTLGQPSVASRGLRILRDLGVAPLQVTRRVADLDASFADVAGVVRPWAWLPSLPDARDPRTQQLLANLLAWDGAATATPVAVANERALSAIAREYCARFGAEPAARSPVHLHVGARGAQRPAALASFDCKPADHEIRFFRRSEER
jgi:hypothetical protein